ncbi:hypothetical protein BZG36_04007 [Bifiguratus adelaidae]|uniref:Helicase C-terminal domain-containing protein n=1 Tax=Bifiguratus adelaidae TaxID=1938954 RepID=A0A261XYF0_9FUNG|nr:hypothetical protein BZG36_04007 [Bifiguratus adelaidae]
MATHTKRQKTHHATETRLRRHGVWGPVQGTRSAGVSDDESDSTVLEQLKSLVKDYNAFTPIPKFGAFSRDVEVPRRKPIQRASSADVARKRPKREPTRRVIKEASLSIPFKQEVNDNVQTGWATLLQHQDDDRPLFGQFPSTSYRSVGNSSPESCNPSRRTTPSSSTPGSPTTPPATLDPFGIKIKDESIDEELLAIPTAVRPPIKRSVTAPPVRPKASLLGATSPTPSSLGRNIVDLALTDSDADVSSSDCEILPIKIELEDKKPDILSLDSPTSSPPHSATTTTAIPTTTPTSTTSKAAPITPITPAAPALPKLPESYYKPPSLESIPSDLPTDGLLPGLRCQLMDHQIDGVKWMMDREKVLGGGILADDMGLGKTIQTLSTILVSRKANPLDPISSLPSFTTLIVCPLALIRQWESEVLSKTEIGIGRVYVHHGSSRLIDPSRFKYFEVVITTYQVVASEYPFDKEAESDVAVDALERKRSANAQFGPLFRVGWHRVVLDEAQAIKNRTTRAAMSCCALRAQKRWCLTGTPLQNNVDELYSLIRFLRLKPLCDHAQFRKQISRPLQYGDTDIAMRRLGVVLSSAMLRRTKHMLMELSKDAKTADAVTSSRRRQSLIKLHEAARDMDEAVTAYQLRTFEADPKLSSNTTGALELPNRHVELVETEFSNDERLIYDFLNQKTRETLNNMLNDKGDSNYMNILCLLLRLRQVCDHPRLVYNALNKDKDAMELEAGMKSARAVKEFRREVSKQQSMNEYWANSVEAVALPTTAAPQEGDNKSDGKRKGIPIEIPGANRNVSTPIPYHSSAKIRKLVEILEETRRNHPNDKTIVFSQFTSMLDFVEGALMARRFRVCRYDGSMPNAARERSLASLRQDPLTTVMLISLRCGSLGLNLTAANRVILLDVWWNPAVEDQAIDRVHRIGQTKPVWVSKLKVKDTIEEKVIALQEEKRRLFEGAMGDKTGFKQSKLSVQEIAYLFS